MSVRAADPLNFSKLLNLCNFQKFKLLKNIKLVVIGKNKNFEQVIKKMDI